MNLSHKAIARMSGYRIKNAGDRGWYWINLDTEHGSMGFGNGTFLHVNQEDAWRDCCEENGLIE